MKTKNNPKRIGAIHIVFRLAKGAVISDRKSATHFSAVSVNGENVYLYIFDKNPDPSLLPMN